jgi:transposase
LRHVFKLALRQLEGFVVSLFDLMGVELKVPEFSRLSRRLSESLKHLKYRKSEEISHIVIDSSGLKVFGEKEFIESQKRKPYFRRIWRKLHIAIDGKGFIRASEMTSHKVNDRGCFEPLIDAIGSASIDAALADTGYDSHKTYKVCEDRNIKTIIPPPKNAKKAYKNKENLKRNETISYIQEKGKHAWEHHNNYGRRNQVENTFYRLKTIFNRQLMSRTWKNQEAESRLICVLLNQMTSLGMPTTQKVS